MMSTAEKGVIMCEEPSLILNGGDASHTEKECIREVIVGEIERNTEEKLASQSPTFISHEDASEDTVMVLKQNSIAEEKDEMYAADESKTKREEVQHESVLSFKKGLSNINEAGDKEIEVDMTSTSKEICAVDETVEEGTEADKTNVTSTRYEMNTAEEAIEESTETQMLTIASSKVEMSITNKAVEEDTEVDKTSSCKEMCTLDETVEEGTDIANANIAEDAVGESTETQNLSAASSKMEVSITNEVEEKGTEVDKQSTSKEICAVDETMEERTADNVNVAPIETDINGTEESTETQNLSTALFSKDMFTVDEILEEGTEADNLNVTSSKNDLNTSENAVERSLETQSSNGAPPQKEVSSTDEAVEEMIETQNLNGALFKMEVSTPYEAVEEITTQNLSAALSRMEMSDTEKSVDIQDLSAGQSKKEVSTADEAVPKMTEAQNLSAGPSKKEVNTTEDATEEPEAQTLNATPSMITVDESVEGGTEAHNLNVGPSKKELSSTVEAVEKRTEAQNLSTAPSKEVESTSEEATTSCKEVSTKEKVIKKPVAQNLSAATSKKEKSTIEEVVKKMMKCRNLGTAPTQSKVISGEEAVGERKETDGASVSSYNQEINTTDEENNLNVGGPSKKVFTAVKPMEKNKEESKASTSALSSSSSGPNISVLQNIPRSNTAVRGRISLNYRRILANRRARLTEGFHFAFNGKTIAPKHPRISAPRVHVTAEAFPSLASELYPVLPETFKNAVSMSMMEYYLMILYFHRLAGLRMSRRTPLPEDEVLCSNLELGPLYVPDMIEQWITMRGHDINTRGEAIRLILPPVPSDTGDFGRLSATTHWRYISDLAPRVFRERIAADLKYTLSSGLVEWDLPKDIRPRERNCGLPTRNLIGYHVAQKLTASQIDVLHMCGIGLWNDKAVFPVDVDAECYQLNIHLVEAVSRHFASLGSNFRIVKHARYNSQSSSAGLIVYGERMVSETEEYLFDRNVSHYEQKAKVKAYAPTALDKELAKGAVVFLPRVFRRDGKRPISRSWCAYDFGFYFMVPDEWTATRNNAYKQGSWQSWHTPHLTTAAILRTNLLKAVIKRLVLSQKQTS